MNPLHILHIFIENVRKITLAKVELPESGVAQITGLNESGKSTFLKSVLWALKGKTGMDNPDTILQEGSNKGRVVLTVGENQESPEYEIDLRFRKGGPLLKVTRIDGGPLPEGLTQSQLLKKFWNDVTLDPLAFAQSEAKKQRAVLLQVAEFDIDEEYMRLTGGATGNPVDMLDAAEKAAYERRTEVGRDMREAEVQLGDYADVHEGAEEINTIEITEQLRAMNERRMTRSRLAADLSNGIERISDINRQIARLHEELAVFEESNRKIMVHLEALPAVDALEVTKLEEKLRRAGDAERVRAKKRLQEKYVQANAAHRDLETRIKRIRECKTKMVERARMPIPGLGFDAEGGGVTYEGEPLEARGISRNLKIGAAVAKALNPLLRLVLLDQGGEIDDNGVRELAQWAQAEDMLVIMAREKGAQGDGIVSFTIEAGEVK